MLQVSLPPLQKVLLVRGWEVVDGIGHFYISALFYLRYYGIPFRNLLAVVVEDMTLKLQCGHYN